MQILGSCGAESRKESSSIFGVSQMEVPMRRRWCLWCTHKHSSFRNEDKQQLGIRWHVCIRSKRCLGSKWGC